MERIRESVMPSGVKFSVRNLKGSDQNTLTTGAENSDNSVFDQLLKDSLRSIGNKNQLEITDKDVSNLLSNDRKFILLTLREHTLGYLRTFKFNFDWPLISGKSNKTVTPYEVNLSPENFPIEPYYWVRDYITDKQKEDKDFKPDGHSILFPVLYENYSDMLTERKYVTGQFKSSGLKYRWSLLDGNQEKKYAKVKMVVNTTIEMRSPQLLFVVEGKEKWMLYDVPDADIMELEQIRGELRDKEGFVDTFLTIQHPDEVRAQKVDLVALPVFFFPSQAI